MDWRDRLSKSCGLKHLTIIFYFLAIPLFLSCGQKASSQNKLLSAQEFKNIINSTDVHLIDVRTAGEFSQGHIEGALNIDFMARNFSEQLSQLSKDKPIVIYCRTGRRSGLSTKTLAKLGFNDIYDLNGGTINWQKEGFKLVK